MVRPIKKNTRPHQQHNQGLIGFAINLYVACTRDSCKLNSQNKSPCLHIDEILTLNVLSQLFFSLLRLEFSFKPFSIHEENFTQRWVKKKCQKSWDFL